MSKRYIPQTPNNDFVYPNNDKVEYDIDILHEINDNVVSGTVENISLTIVGSQLRLQYTYSYNRNNSIPFVNTNGYQEYISVHMLAPGQEYFKPWRMVDVRGTYIGVFSTAYVNTTGAAATVFLNLGEFGITSWPEGQYVFEFRLIGLKQNYVICETASLVLPTPTPTPSPSPTPTVEPGPPTPTPTPTPVPEPPTPTPTGAILYTHGAVRATCSDFCDTNYTITTLTAADNTYLALTLGDTIYGQGGIAGFVAYSDQSTDTNTGPFRIAEIDTNGIVQDILICDGVNCVPL